MMAGIPDNQRPLVTTTSNRRGYRRLFAAVSTLSFLTSVALPDETKAQPSWEYSPYQILVWTCTTPNVHLAAAQHEQFAGRLTDLAEIAEGAAWSVKVDKTPPELAIDQRIDDQMLSVAAIEGRAPTALQNDKLFFVTLGGSSRNYEVTVRELDCRTQFFGPRIVRPVRLLTDLPREALAAMREAFAAMVRIESGVGNGLTVRLRAGGLATRPNSRVAMSVGDILQPIVRRNDRVGNPLQIDSIEWTFMRVTGRDETNPNLLQVQVHSGFRSPIRGRVASNREQYGLAIRPRHAKTNVTVEAKVPHDAPPYPLAGLEIYLRDPLDRPEKASPQQDASPRFIGYTDWRGSIDIPRGESPLQIAYLKSGGQLLARLPIVAGLARQRTARVADDNARLEAEGNVRGFNNQLIDLVAQRQIIAADIRRHLAENRASEARRLLDKFSRLPTRSDMQRQLDLRRNRQRTSSDQMVQSRIDILYGESRRTLAKYLSPSLGSALMREVSATEQSDSRGN